MYKFLGGSRIIMADFYIFFSPNFFQKWCIVCIKNIFKRKQSFYSPLSHAVDCEQQKLCQKASIANDFEW